MCFLLFLDCIFEFGVLFIIFSIIFWRVEFIMAFRLRLLFWDLFLNSFFSIFTICLSDSVILHILKYNFGPTNTEKNLGKPGKTLEYCSYYLWILIYTHTHSMQYAMQYAMHTYIHWRFWLCYFAENLSSMHAWFWARKILKWNNT